MADQTLAKYVNELSILTVLRTQGGQSRADIARKLSLTPATITRLIANLEVRGLVREVRQQRVSGAREVGRPGLNVEIDPEGAYFLGIEIGVGIIRFALLNLLALTVNSSEVFVSRSLEPAEAVKAIGDHIAMLSHDIRFRDRILGVGVTIPGLVTNSGYIINLPILGWKDVDLGALLKEVTSLPCSIENNANAAAFGSVYTQPGLSSVSAVFLKLGTGVGGAAILNGRLLRGATGTAGELGHIKLSENGPLCSCGQRGCLEARTNLRALARGYLGTDELSEEKLFALPAEVAMKAADGDAKAIEAIKQLSHWLGIGLVSLVNVFNPGTVVLGGAMLPVAEACLEEVRDKIRTSIIPGIAMPDVRLSPLGKYECAVGAAAIAHHNAFDISRVSLAEPEVHP
ncbi:ROK family transcriptional regulator [Mesorhizobium sp.]|uniref:ROK family transcriptional regulator n=1 Tax=Mesorhizobium sp. TaxID=1871066 RepID=UPI0025D34DC9|nr:ROK family transcriptional regulator [Mesorhizobium sp.]